MVCCLSAVLSAWFIEEEDNLGTFRDVRYAQTESTWEIWERWTYWNYHYRVPGFGMCGVCGAPCGKLEYLYWTWTRGLWLIKYNQTGPPDNLCTLAQCFGHAARDLNTTSIIILLLAWKSYFEETHHMWEARVQKAAKGKKKKGDPGRCEHWWIAKEVDEGITPVTYYD